MLVYFGSMKRPRNPWFSNCQGVEHGFGAPKAAQNETIKPCHFAVRYKLHHIRKKVSNPRCLEFLAEYALPNHLEVDDSLSQPLDLLRFVGGKPLEFSGFTESQKMWRIELTILTIYAFLGLPIDSKDQVALVIPSHWGFSVVVKLSNLFLKLYPPHSRGLMQRFHVREFSMISQFKLAVRT